MNSISKFPVPAKLIASVVGALLFLIVSIFTLPGFVEVVDSSETKVCTAYNGTMTAYKDPGIKFTGWATCETYPLMAQVTFSDTAKGSVDGPAVNVNFSDKAQGQVEVSARVQFPTTEKDLINLHKNYKGPKNVITDIVGRQLKNIVANVSNQYSSTEVATAGRSIMQQDINEQAANGICELRTEEVVVELSEGEDDSVKKTRKEFTVRKVLAQNGQCKRVSENPLTANSLQLANVTVENLTFAESVQNQLNAQREAVTRVQTAKAEAEAAKQQTQTIIQKGLAAAAQAKAEAEVVTATQEAEAQRAIIVAKANAERMVIEANAKLEATELDAKSQIVRAQAEAKEKQLKLSADNGFQAKLDQEKEIALAWAEAVKTTQMPLVPETVVINGSDAKNSSSLMDLTSLFLAKEGVKAVTK